jgi:hypothetical protein
MRTVLISALLLGEMFLRLEAEPPIRFLPTAGGSVTAVTDGKTPVTRTFNLNLYSASEGNPVFESHGLHGPDGDLGPGSITAAATVKCPAGAWVVVPLTISGTFKTGSYAGSVEFREAKTKPGEGIHIPIAVTAVGKPLLTVDTVALSAYRCWFSLDCAVGNFLAPMNQNVPLSNKDGLAPALIKRGAVTLRASTGDSSFGETDLALQKPKEVAAQNGDKLSLTVPSGKAVAGRYQGYASVELDNKDVISGPITLDVRDAPLMAMILLTAGIVFGRVLQSVNSPDSLTRQRLNTNLAALRAASDSVTDPAVRVYLEKKMADARQDIATMIAGEAVLTKSVQDIATAVSIESNLEWVVANLNLIPTAAQAAVQTDVDTARTALVSDDLQTADTNRRSAQGKLLSHLQIAGLLAAPLATPSAQFDLVLKPPPPQGPHVRAASLLAGISPHAPAGRYPFLKASMFIALLLGLMVVGLYGLYIKNATFGASPLFDYFGVAVWGLSADVAQRSLQGLQLPR